MTKKQIQDKGKEMNPDLNKVDFLEFIKIIKKMNNYIEYGSGGSTITALENGLNVITAETDRRWVKKVKDKAVELNLEQNLNIEFTDFGEIKNYGYPKVFNKEKALEYVNSVWNRAKAIGMKPDVILIDGRFRVSSFIKSYIESDSGTIILFDDFMRSDYDFVRSLGIEYQLISRMAIIEKKEHIEIDENKIYELLISAI
jgi:hypothetical protein